ncbi:MAG: nucleoside monophosphate kinase [bacterium]|nr:nucleoside monophosphate kinase [bacterium]
MDSKAILFFGIPGAGKGTQADLLARKKRWIHFDTGPYLKDILYSPESTKDPVLQEQKRIWDAGQLNDPSWVLSETAQFAQRMATCKQSIIFSGSPRTLFEAWGDTNHEGLIDLLVRSYQKDTVHFFFLDLPPTHGGTRNSTRRLCSSCKLIILSNKETAPLTHCVTCGADLVTRTILDAPEKYRERLSQFKERTEPVIHKLQELDFIVHTIMANKEPWRIHQEVCDVIDAK